ncbi:hypothetical protein LK09_01125 [Microbacterium mangrovi]|uniref:Big-1 domain-containing protein n=1 Tax=Microbacterium mangrovi TaxID=1348253 RepID=A0A0B2AE84_9MICO|nr:Ig-like domain-containing protein [Microbacterium mangrovi]KHK99951.1 hypothetical protein LK09_01125 [Microbacterium mangrovi]
MAVAGVATTGALVPAGSASAATIVTADAGAADAATSTIAANSSSIVADGTSTSTVTVTVRDASGTPVAAGGDLVAMKATHGTLSSVTDHGDGTYTAVLTAGTVAQPTSISFTVNGVAGGSKASVEFVPGPPVLANAQIFAFPDTAQADGTEAVVVVVNVRDANGNRVDVGDDLAFTTTLGRQVDLTHNKKGTYQADFVSTVAGVGTVGFTVAGKASPVTTQVTFLGGAADAAGSTIMSSADAIPADGTSTADITVAVKDAHGNAVRAGGDDVTMQTTAGTLSAVTDHGDGTYTATLSAPSTAGSATVGFTVNGTSSAATATVDFTPVPDAGGGTTNGGAGTTSTSGTVKAAAVGARVNTGGTTAATGSMAGTAGFLALTALGAGMLGMLVARRKPRRSE